MKKLSSLRRRWIWNTVGIIGVLGLLCLVGVVVAFTHSLYSNMEYGMRDRAQSTAEYFAQHLNQSYNEYYGSCITYAQTFEDRNTIELQFINASGGMVASSYGQWSGPAPTTPEILEAVQTRDLRAFAGKDPETGERIMAVSCPMIYTSGEVIGVLRYVTSTRLMDRQVLQIGAIGLMALSMILGAVVLSMNYYVRTVLHPLAEITEKAKRIAGGTYGIQIQNRYNVEIGELADTINELSSQLDRNEKMQTEFISSLSHELRTPLTAITGWSETLIGDETLDTDTLRGMKIILREARRLTEMVVDLLDFTRIQDGRMTLHVESADIRGEFEDTVYMYGSRLAQDGIRLRYLDNDEEIPEIICDAKRMRQVFLNILDNAAKHGGDGKEIQASIHCEENAVRVEIRDFGPGIPEDEIPLVTKKFYKGSSKARGSGIGLAVCEEIVTMHGGELILENAPGGGTLVTVRLPAVQ